MVKKHHLDTSKHCMMIIGAGEVAATIIKGSVNSSYLEGSVLCAIDDDKHKLGTYIQGIKVVGNRYHILEGVHKYKIMDIIIAMQSTPKKVTKEILEICKETNCNLKMLLGMYQLINEEVSVSCLKPVEIEDLLGRDTSALNLDEIMGYVNGKVVMVTGGGDSIGSELCRQIVKYQLKQLIVIDIYENNVYDIQMELKRKYPMHTNKNIAIGLLKDWRV